MGVPPSPQASGSLLKTEPDHVWNNWERENNIKGKQASKRPKELQQKTCMRPMHELRGVSKWKIRSPVSAMASISFFLPSCRRLCRVLCRVFSRAFFGDFFPAFLPSFYQLFCRLFVDFLVKIFVESYAALSIWVSKFRFFRSQNGRLCISYCIRSQYLD